jgi:hypothetical protein
MDDVGAIQLARMVRVSSRASSIVFLLGSLLLTLGAVSCLVASTVFAIYDHGAWSFFNPSSRSGEPDFSSMDSAYI